MIEAPAVEAMSNLFHRQFPTPRQVCQCCDVVSSTPARRMAAESHGWEARVEMADEFEAGCATEPISFVIAVASHNRSTPFAERWHGDRRGQIASERHELNLIVVEGINRSADVCRMVVRIGEDSNLHRNPRLTHRDLVFAATGRFREARTRFD